MSVPNAVIFYYFFLRLCDDALFDTCLLVCAESAQTTPEAASLSASGLRRRGRRGRLDACAKRSQDGYETSCKGQAPGEFRAGTRVQVNAIGPACASLYTTGLAAN